MHTQSHATIKTNNECQSDTNRSNPGTSRNDPHAQIVSTHEHNSSENKHFRNASKLIVNDFHKQQSLCHRKTPDYECYTVLTPSSTTTIFMHITPQKQTHVEPFTTAFPFKIASPFSLCKCTGTNTTSTRGSIRTTTQKKQRRKKNNDAKKTTRFMTNQNEWERFGARIKRKLSDWKTNSTNGPPWCLVNIPQPSHVKKNIFVNVLSCLPE